MLKGIFIRSAEVFFQKLYEIATRIIIIKDFKIRGRFMNRYDSNLLSFRRWASVLGGLLLLVLGGFYFFYVSAQTEIFEKTAEQNFAPGRLAFTSRQAGPTAPNGRIIITNPDGSGGTSLPIPLSLSPTEPAWSPDAAKMAFVSTQTPGDIFVINTDGSGQTNLTNTADPVRESNPSWSATGKIAYERSFQVWVMNADGSGQVQFPGITQSSSADPAWSPDGGKLAFSSGGEIWVINADGTNEQRLTTTGSTDTDPAWSPDGTKIVFAKSGVGIAVINADGTNETPLTNTGGDSQPSWSPD